jgi:hypothetical protein
VSWQNEGQPRDNGDDGSADAGVAAALAAYAAGEGSEHAALTALARSRLLVPVVAVPGGEAPAADPGPAPAGAAAGRALGRGGTGSAHGSGGPGRRGAAVTEMALPTLVGNDGRTAVLAFSCLDSLARWRPDARPVPVPAALVWQAGAAEADAVVVDVAGPVPLAVDGARLAAMSAGGPAPPPHQDPDVLAAAHRVAGGEQVISGVAVAPGTGGNDLTLRLTLASGCSAASPAAQAAARRAAGELVAAAGGKLRRGVEVMLITGGAR